MRRELNAGAAMTAPVVTAPPSATLEAVAKLMLSERVGCVVVVDAEDREWPVGIVTETDFEVTDDPIPFTFFVRRRRHQVCRRRRASAPSYSTLAALATSWAL